MSKKPRLVVIGDSDWTDSESVAQAIDRWWDSTGQNPDAILAVSDEVSGASKIAELWWASKGAEQIKMLPVERYFSSEYPSSAELYRDMLDGGADQLLVFVRDGSANAEEMCILSSKAGVDVDVTTSSQLNAGYPVTLVAECCEGRGCTTNLFLVESSGEMGMPRYEYRRQSNGDVFGYAGEVVSI